MRKLLWQTIVVKRKSSMSVVHPILHNKWCCRENKSDLERDDEHNAYYFKIV